MYTGKNYIFRTIFLVKLRTNTLTFEPMVRSLVQWAVIRISFILSSPPVCYKIIIRWTWHSRCVLFNKLNEETCYMWVEDYWELQEAHLSFYNLILTFSSILLHTWEAIDLWIDYRLKMNRISVSWWLGGWLFKVSSYLAPILVRHLVPLLNVCSPTATM